MRRTQLRLEVFNAVLCVLADAGAPCELGKQREGFGHNASGACDHHASSIYPSGTASVTVFGEPLTQRSFFVPSTLCDVANEVIPSLTLFESIQTI